MPKKERPMHSAWPTLLLVVARAATAGARPLHDAAGHALVAPATSTRPPAPGYGGGGSPSGFSSSFTVYSSPIALRYGEVSNYHYDGGEQPPDLPLPREVVERYADGTRHMAVSNFTVDFVRRHADGSETSVPQYELYDHHHFVQINDPDGERLQTFGASFEFRHSQFGYQHPYRRVMTRPTSWVPYIHVINLKDPAAPFDGRPSPLLQCPCTPQRVIDLDIATIDGLVIGLQCPPALAGNPACSLSTYIGGTHCCERGLFVRDTTACAQPGCTEYPVDVAYLKTTFYYEDVTPATRNIHEMTCCDLAADHREVSNVEFDIVPCEASLRGTAGCVRTFSSVLPLDIHAAPGSSGAGYTDVVELAYALPHVHEGGLSITLQDAATNATLCAASRADRGIRYGGGRAAGDEEDFITGFRTCTWSPANAPRLPRNHPLRITAVYDASRYITGAMARFVIAGYDATGRMLPDLHMRAASSARHSSSRHMRMHRRHF